MKKFTAKEIKNLQNNLQLIRQAGGWSAEEFGEMIGVTKQTIRNLEKKTTEMSKIQYIAIRAVLDYEIADRPDDKVLATTVNLCLNSEDLSEQDKKKAQVFLEGASKTNLEDDVLAAGLISLVGSVTALTLMSMSSVNGTVKWLSKLLKDK